MLGLIVLLGFAIRLRVLPSGGLFQDDAWVALTGTTSWSQAFKMAGTAPGFVGLLHLWLPFSSSSLWAVTPALLIGLAGLISLAVVLQRLWSNALFTALGVFTIALSPVATATSGHVKQYTLDFLISLWITYLAVRARRFNAKDLGLLLAASLGGLFLSGSTVIVIAAAWLVVTLQGIRHHNTRRRALVGAGCFGLGFVALFVACYSTLPVALNRYWANYLLQPFPLNTWPSRLGNVIRGLTTGFVPTTTAISHEVLFATIVLWSLILLGALSKDPLAGRGIAVATLGVAIGLALLSKVPLGTGRTDMAVYPALLMLSLGGLQEVIRTARSARLGIRRIMTIAVAVSTAPFIVTGIMSPHRYLNTPIEEALALAKTCPGATPSTLVIDAYTRYPYALTTTKTVTEHFSRQYGAGFTVSVPRTQAAILPAQSYERPYRPIAWANEVANQLSSRPSSEQRIAYLQTPPQGPQTALAQRTVPMSEQTTADPFLEQLFHRGYAANSDLAVGPILVTCLQVTSSSPR
jgi:hypothetical protein